MVAPVYAAPIGADARPVEERLRERLRELVAAEFGPDGWRITSMFVVRPGETEPLVVTTVRAS